MTGIQAAVTTEQEADSTYNCEEDHVAAATELNAEEYTGERAVRDAAEYRNHTKGSTKAVSYTHLPKQPENHFSEQLPLSCYSRGMGALGLPGDLSSASRFARAAFTRLHSVSGRCV